MPVKNRMPSTHFNQPLLPRAHQNDSTEVQKINSKTTYKTEGVKGTQVATSKWNFSPNTILEDEKREDATTQSMLQRGHSGIKARPPK